LTSIIAPARNNAESTARCLGTPLCRKSESSTRKQRHYSGAFSIGLHHGRAMSFSS
jgi:hypothetical protein